MIEGTTNDFFVGAPGSGKTLLAVYDYVLPALLRGELVYSTTWINWNGFNLKYFTADDFQDNISNFQNCLVFFDEVQRVLEPRDWDSESGAIRAFFQLHRHRHVNIIGTTQDISLIAKSALIVVDNFIYTEKVDHSLLSRLLYGSSSIPLCYHYLTRQQLRSVFNFFDMGQDVPVLERPIRSYMRLKSLLRRDLDDLKVELYHYYCSLCASRQSPSISKDVDPFNSPVPFCPKHLNQPLEIRVSAMYDTDFEVQSSSSPDVIWKAYRRVKVDKLVESRSILTPTGLVNQNKGS